MGVRQEVGSGRWSRCGDGDASAYLRCCWDRGGTHKINTITRTSGRRPRAGEQPLEEKHTAVDAGLQLHATQLVMLESRENEERMNGLGMGCTVLVGQVH
jgi:hypothetical protein